MTAASSARRRLLMLGPDTGWHADQIRAAARRRGHHLDIASYESMAAGVANPGSPLSLCCDAGRMLDYDAILTRTMPAGSMEKITFRLAMLHAISDQLTPHRTAIVNPPRALEWSIDKFASLAKLAAAGYPTPPTRVVQSRREAMQAFEELGGDCVVKPLFGGEGRGVMRIRDAQLAWYSFSTLEQLDAVLQLQTFISPGGRDTRVLVVGRRVYGLRRSNERSFRSNVSAGATCQRFEVDATLEATARQITQRFGLVFASVDLIDNEHGPPLFLEVNAIPGWKGAQNVIDHSIADSVIEALETESERLTS
ncbi:ATP-grasp domain-containing protein [Rhodopirellula sp. JC639]|uniref:ATP-grasp domain-containing protein n=1 Tax=Stieleria mannarensis TaxID=2755585 RepID=UPI0016044729|nr:RimK family alpha-L-glutamate ligase [Rhodopirellula sp. JC639]